jgi:putative endonuclease
MTKPEPAKEKQRAAYGLGHRGETRAAWALHLKGYRIVARRFKTPSGEIDLVAIVEVKARRTLTEAMDAITTAALRRIEAAADLCLSRQPDHARLSMRFDMVAILPRRWPVHVPAIHP